MSVILNFLSQYLRPVLSSPALVPTQDPIPGPTSPVSSLVSSSEEDDSNVKAQDKKRPLSAKEISFSQISSPNTPILVSRLGGAPGVIQRLQEMGLRPGQEVIFRYQAPFWGPKIFEMGTLLLALRERESRCIFGIPRHGL